MSTKIVPKNRKAHNAWNHEYYLFRLNEVNPCIVPLERYVNARYPIWHWFLDCGHLNKTSPQSLFKYGRCKKCSDKRRGTESRKTHEQFLEIVLSVNPRIKILSKYMGADRYVKCLCLDCGGEWETLAANLYLRESGCPYCQNKLKGLKLRKTHEAFVEEMRATNPLIEILGEYITAKDSIKCRCTLCGFIWSPDAGELCQGKGCPICCLSHGERKIAKYLQKCNILFHPQYSFDELVGLGGGLLSYDFYLPNHSMLIEYQGEQHLYPKTGYFGGIEQFKIQQEHDKRKREYAKQHDIKLLEIWYYDYDKIEDILKEQLNLESVETVIET